MTPSPSWCLLRRLEKVLSSLSTFGPESTLVSNFQKGSLQNTQRDHTCSEEAWMDLSLWLHESPMSVSASLEPQTLTGLMAPLRIIHLSGKPQSLHEKWTNQSVFMLGSSLLRWVSSCTASWWATFTLWDTHTLYCKGRRSILGSDCRQNCCLLSTPSWRGISGDTSTATPACWEEIRTHMKCLFITSCLSEIQLTQT